MTAIIEAIILIQAYAVLLYGVADFLLRSL